MSADGPARRGMPADAPDGHAAQCSSHATRRAPSRGRAAQCFALLCICTVAMLLVAACGVTATTSEQGTPGAAASATLPPAQIPPGWRRYRDPGGYFTLGLPPGWQVTSSSESFPMTSVEANFAPSGGNPQAAADGLGFEISYTAYTHPDQSAACTIYQHSNTTLAGVKAERQPPDRLHIWLIGTSAATYQVHYHLPGELIPGQMITTLPTPAPSATVTAAQNLIGALLATLRLTPATPPTC